MRDGVGWPEILVWWRGDIYENRFLWGVEGVRLAVGSDEEDTFVGGVLDLDGSLMVVDRVEVCKVGSGNSEGGVGCGTDVSKSSERSSVEKVRFASSASHCQSVQLGL